MLELRDVDTYYGTIQALRNVSLSIGDGEIVTLIGANGAGKSTTLMTICGILHPRHGEVLLDGEPIKCYYCTGNGGQTLTPAMCWGAANASDAAYDLRFDPYDVAGSDDAVVLEFTPDAAGWPEAAAAFLLRQARRQDARVAEVLFEG